MKVSAITEVNFNGVKRVKKLVDYMHRDGLTSIAEETVVSKTGLAFVFGKIQNGFRKTKNAICKIFKKKEHISNTTDATIVSKQLVVSPINFHTRYRGLEVVVPIHHKHVAGQLDLKNGTNVKYTSCRPGVTVVEIKNSHDKTPTTLRILGGEQGITPEEIKYLMDGPIKDLRKQIDEGTLMDTIDVAGLFKK